eukprot:gene9265-6635_t
MSISTAADVEARIKAIDGFLETNLRNFSVTCKLDLPDGDSTKSAQWELTLYSLTCTASILLTLHHYTTDNSLILELQNVEEPRGHDSIAYVRLFEALQASFGDAGAEKRKKMLPVDKILDPSIFNGPNTKKRQTEPVDKKILSRLVQQCHNAAKKDFVFCAPRSSASSTATAAASVATPASEIPASASAPGYRMIGEAMYAIEGLRELYLRYKFDEEDTAVTVTALLEAMKRPDLPTTQRAMASALLDATITPTKKDATKGQEESVTGETAYIAPPSSHDATKPTDGQLTATTNETPPVSGPPPEVAPKRSKQEKQSQIPSVDSFPVISRDDDFPTEDFPPTATASDSDKAMDVVEVAEVAESLCLPRHVCDALRPHRDEHMALLGESLDMLVSFEKVTAAKALDLVSLGGLVACLVRFAVAWSCSDSTVALDRRICSCLQCYCDAVQLDDRKGRNSGGGGDGGVRFAHSRLGDNNATQLQRLRVVNYTALLTWVSFIRTFQGNNNVTVIKWLLNQRSEGVRVADEEGRLPLHLAAGYNSNVEVVRWLWEQHPEGVRVADKEGRLPLHWAAGYNSNVEVVRWLWEQHPEDVRVADEEGRLPLHWAARDNSNVEMVRWLLGRHPEDVRVADKEGRLPLHWAAVNNSNVEVVRWLWEQHPEGVRVADKEGRLPLHWAAGYNSNVEVVRWLWEQHPEAVRVADKEGRLPLHWAAGYNSNVEVVRWLLGDGMLYFEKSVSFLTKEVVTRLNDRPALKMHLHDIVGKMVAYSLSNPHYAAYLREIFDYDMGLFNLQRGFKGTSTRSRLTVNVHVCGEKLAGKTTLSSWLQKKLQKRTTWFDRASALVSRPAMAELVGHNERTPGLLIHRVDNPQEVEYVLHDYGGHEEFRKVYRQFLNVPQSIYVVVLPLVLKRSDTEHRAYSAEEVVSQYRQWLGQIHNALQGASQPPTNKTAVITLLNKFSGVLPEAEMPRRSEIRKRLKQCQETPALASTFAFYPCVSVDCRNEHDVMSVCATIETWVTQQRAFPEVRTATTAASFPVVEYLRDSFDREPIASQFVEETEYQAEVRRRLLDGGYLEYDELWGSLDLLVRWWVADSLRTRRILRLSAGPGKEDIIVTSVEALSHWLFGKVLDDIRRRFAVVIRRAAVRDIVRETIKMNFDAAELLVDVGLFTRITAYDAVSGQVETLPPSAAASDDDLFLVIGLISQRVGAEDMRPPEFRAETTRRIHRWYTLDPEKAVDWGPDFFVTLCQCVLSLVPSCRSPRIYKDAIYAMTDDGQRRTTYIVRPHRHESLGDGFEVIVDVSKDLRGLTFDDVVRKDDVVWMGLQAINATCRRLVDGEGLREYCVYPDPRSTLWSSVSPRWAADVERELKEAEAHGQDIRVQLQKFLYGYFPLEGLTDEDSKANLPHELVASVQLQHRSIEQLVEDAKSLHRLFSETIAQMVQEITKLHEACESATAAAAVAVAVTSPLAVVDRSRLLAMESTLNNLFRAQLNISRNLCDFPLLVFLQPAKAQSLGAMVSSVFTKRYNVCCVCPVCGSVAQSDAAYELRVSKGKWHRYLLRALQVSMVLAGVALKAAGVPTLAADALYGATTTILSDVSKELGTLVDAYRNDVTSAMASPMEDAGGATAPGVAGPPSNATAAAVNTIGQQPLDRERRVSWEFIRAMKALFTESLRDPEAARSGLARIWSDDGDVAFVCADASRGCRERFRRDGRKCLRVVAVYGG